MQTHGLIVTLDDESQTPAVLATLAAGPFLAGEPIGLRIPFVLESATPDEAHNWHDWAATQPGVTNVEVVFSHWEPTHADE